MRDKHSVVPMKTIGILGGMSNVSTGEVYRLVNEKVNQHLGGSNAAELLIYSVNFENIKHFIRNQQWADAAEYLTDKARRLERGGADFIMMPTNTLHIVADDIAQSVNIPFLHIIDVTAEELKKHKIKRAGVLGTKTTMEAEFYAARFADKHGIELVSPELDERIEVDRIIFEELCSFEVKEESRNKYFEVINNLKARGAEAIILGCTEIFLLINKDNFHDLPLFDTTDIQIDKAVKISLGIDLI